jgi:hypothetical protein
MKRLLLFLGLLLAGCTHLLAQVDVDALRDSQALEASAIQQMDAGSLKTKVTVAYCSTHAVLARSDDADDAGVGCPQ